MPGTIKFSYRAAVDVVVATVDWTLDTEEDVRLWYEEYKAYFAGRFSRKVDLILELSDFHVNPRIGALFGQCRIAKQRRPGNPDAPTGPPAEIQNEADTSR